MFKKGAFVLSIFLLCFSFIITGCSNSAKTQKQNVKTSATNATVKAKETASTGKTLKLFGVSLNNATRSEIEPVLIKNGFTPLTVGPNYWYDTYKVNGELKGANRLNVGYTRNSRFAIAQYVFDSFMNTRLVTHVVAMVEDKYGSPSSYRGNPSLGDVTAKWHINSNLEVKVYRGWPSTTVYLSLENIRNYNRMQDQIQAQKQAKTKKQASAQGNAF